MTQKDAARELGVARTTLARWEKAELDRQPELRARGRPAHRASRDERRELLHVLEREGAGIGIPELFARFPKLARREIEELCARRAYALHRRGKSSLHRLRWTRPGSVWATDFSQVSPAVDGEYPRLLLVRDLASGEQLSATPCLGESAHEVGLVVEHLVEEHGAPLVLKMDNGSGFIAQVTRDLLAKHGVLVLYSPPWTPSYNGACEAGVGSIKHRAARIAAHAGRAGRWSADDVERARLQANLCTRPHGRSGPSPDALWLARAPITDDERRAFAQTYAALERVERRDRNISELATLERADQAIIDRAVIPRALVQHGFLEIRRG